MEILVAAEKQMGAPRRRVGAHLLDSYFGGDAEAVRSRNPRKSMSYAEVVRRAQDETTWDEAKLRRAITAEIVARQLGVELGNRIDVTYLAVLYSVDDLRVRWRLAERIASGELSGRAAKAAIARESKKESHGGRPARSPVEKAVADLEAVVQGARDKRVFDAARLRRVKDSVAAPLAGRLRQLAGELMSVADELDK